MFQVVYEPEDGEPPRRLTVFAGFNVNGFFYKIFDTDTLEILKTWPSTAATTGGMQWGSCLPERSQAVDNFDN
eukprot:TRINITY_DN63_c0_g1_i1.p2 TRINITY_DN63_c0_g1~~TRINITY_DN63_c0_g1_i1.p2  ORF type:complete len:73 (-),score=3.29 TRINITY_DN63_c0_g1_i1:858-1076(-)